MVVYSRVRNKQSLKRYLEKNVYVLGFYKKIFEEEYKIKFVLFK